MKKRLTVNSLAGHNIKAGKKKYTLMIIGIVLAMIFSTGAVFMTSSIISGVKDLVDKNIGRENIIFCGLDDNIVTDALNAGIITDYAEGENIGYIISEGNGDGASVAKLSDKAYDMTYTTVLEGRYPEKKGEIALENDFYFSLKTDAEVGDEITVKFKVQSGNENLEKEIEKTYILTGILHDRRKLIYENSGMANIPAAFVSSEEEVEIGGKAQKLIFAIKGSGVNSSSFYNFIEPYMSGGYGAQGLFLNRDMYNLPSGATIIIENGALMVVLAVVMMIASCIGIVNAFNSNLLERKKQIGLLRAIGTTKRQIFKIFGREAFIIALICTPISIFVSFFGTKLIISLIGNGLIFIPNFAVLAGGAAFSVVCVMAAALIPLKRASSISPMQAVRNVDMIRRMKKRKIKQKKEFNVSLLTAKRNMTFSKGKTAAVSIMLIITILLSSVAVAYLNHEFEENFITSSTDYYVRTYYGSFNNYMNIFYSDSKEMLSENTLRDVMRNPYVESVTFSERRRVAILPQKESKFLEIYSAADKDLLLDDTDAANINKDNYKEYLEKNVINDDLESYTQSKLSLPSNIVGADLLAVNDKKLKNIESRVAEGKINIDKINSGEEIIIVVPKGEVFLCASISTDAFGENEAMLYVAKSDRISLISKQEGVIVLDSAESDFHVGDEIDLSMIYYFENDSEGLSDDNIEEGSIEKYDKTVKIGAIVESDLVLSQYEYAYPLGFVTSLSGLETFGAKHRIDNFSINLKSECTEEINESVMDTINRITAGMNNHYIHSEYETQRSDENTAKALYTALASIILLLFAICVNIVNNSLTSRIRENKREIGTLRAVGATVGELTKSYIYQLSYMLSVGVVGGLGLLGALAGGAKIYEKATGVSIILSLRFEIPILICLTLFVICSLNLYIQIKKMTKNSIIENIREL